MADKFQRAMAYLDRLPVAVSGAGGHNATLRAACECYRFGLSRAEAAEAMAWFNEYRCQPKWSAHELAHKLNDAERIVGGAGQSGKRLGPEPGRGWSRGQHKGFVPPPAPRRKVVVAAPLYFSDDAEEEARWLEAVASLGYASVAEFDAAYDAQAARVAEPA